MPTLVSGAALVGLLVLARADGLLAPALSVLFALTVPHMAVVALLDGTARAPSLPVLSTRRCGG